ncbi:CBS domain-containing protein [Marinilongibacter aquaticus]|uniref:CBS domain-containing protein n=1 Tax=Marinilongibacter aquaticus TaxID=2975157 RepID=UPI0021BD4510|nr:CBS domain-containing protein [Marinilongibacter aquaticus]UBM57963.1 CBS domain-containing protein [Marinilongibacter aquaticus]
MATKIDSILKAKAIHEIISIAPDTTVIDALAELEKYGIGAILVMDGDDLKGIFSERDYARKGILKGRKAKSTPITEVMTSNVFTVGLGDTIIECMEIMNERGFRHLPVVNDANRVVGMLSVKDIVNALIKEQRQHIHFLENYITSAG